MFEIFDSEHICQCQCLRARFLKLLPLVIRSSQGAIVKKQQCLRFILNPAISMQDMLCVCCLFADNLRFTLHLQRNQTFVQERAVISPFFTSLLSTCESELSGKAEPQHWRVRGVLPLLFAKSNIWSFN